MFTKQSHNNSWIVEILPSLDFRASSISHKYLRCILYLHWMGQPQGLRGKMRRCYKEDSELNFTQPKKKNIIKKNKKNFMAPFYGWGSNATRLQSHYKETAYFLPFSSQEFLELDWLTSEGWKVELTLQMPYLKHMHNLNDMNLMLSVFQSQHSLFQLSWNRHSSTIWPSDHWNGPH